MVVQTLPTPLKFMIRVFDHLADTACPLQQYLCIRKTQDKEIRVAIDHICTQRWVMR